MSSDNKHESLPSTGTGSSSSAAEANLSSHIKHPLQTSWTLFYKDPDFKGDWANAVKDVFAFDSVEDFWALYRHITLLSALKKGSDYSLFRGGLSDMKSIRPEWEDPLNKAGGCWKFRIDAKADPKLVDDIVQELMMSCIGEMYGDVGDSVNGIVASTRKQEYRFEIWTKDIIPEHYTVIGQKLQEILPAGQKIILDFMSNFDLERASKGGARNPRSLSSLTVY